jgi:cysteine-S-conjugate beta-lyase
MKALAHTVGPPIQKGSTVLMDRAADLYNDDLITYGRGGLAAQDTLAEALAALEHAEKVFVFPSGLAGITGALLAVLRAGDEILVTDSAYKPTRRFCDRALSRYGVSTRYYAPDATAGDLAAMIGPATRLILLESPGSLTFEVQDAPGIAAMARARGVLTLLDNTWGAGHFFKPLDHGIDISVQALTKYMSGHSDVFMGSAAVKDPELVKLFDNAILDVGWSVAPEDAYMMLRGQRTLAARMARHQETALLIAHWLAAHPRVRRVLYPALPSDPGHAVWKRDYTGAAGLFGFVLEPVPEEKVLAFLDALKLFGLGFSWGGFESLALHCDPQLVVRRTPPAFGGPLMRLNIGLEEPADLIADLERGFAALG